MIGPVQRVSHHSGFYFFAGLINFLFGLLLMAPLTCWILALNVPDFSLIVSPYANESLLAAVLFWRLQMSLLAFVQWADLGTSCLPLRSVRNLSV